jgi:ABC-type transport system substrate-binding protein
MLIDDVTYIPLYYSVGSFLTKPYVTGFGTNAFFDHYWNEIQILSH